MKKYLAFFIFFTLFAVFPAIITLAQDVQHGNATWYEDESLDLNASHARLPPGTRLRVTNMKNQKEVYVTITNRIQNSDVRILDISQEAANILGMNEKGTTPIRLEVIRGLIAEPKPAETPAPTVYNTEETVVAYADNSAYSDSSAYSENSTYSDNSAYEEEFVPEILAISVPDDEEDYDGYKDKYSEDDEPIMSATIEPSTPPTLSTPSSPPPPVRTYPQPGSTAQQKPASPSQAESRVLLKKIVVLVNGREETIDMPDGVYIPIPQEVNKPSTPASSQPPSRTAPSATAQSSPSNIKIIPKLPDPNNGKVYRIQVAAYSRVALAQVCFDRLKSAGFSPSYEQNGNLYRVVISGIRAADVAYAAQRLGAIGFTEAWIREESKR
jgi:cell division septation protein DedD